MHLRSLIEELQEALMGGVKVHSPKKGGAGHKAKASQGATKFKSKLQKPKKPPRRPSSPKPPKPATSATKAKSKVP